jgi:ATP-dependent Clp protease ATP-binding subunit ClpA
VKYTNDAIKTAVELSARYINDRKLPDKAIDVIDEGARCADAGAPKKRKQDHRPRRSRRRRQDGPHPAQTVSKDDRTARSIWRKTSSAWSSARTRRSRRCRAIKLARAGLREPEKPIGNYLFSGPTGVGKTEVAKQLASIARRRTAALRHVGIHGAPHASAA